MEYDKLSFALIVMTFLIFLWSLVNVPITSFDDLKLILVPIILILGGLGLEEKFSRKQSKVGIDLADSFTPTNMRYVGIALGAFFTTSFFVSYIPLKIVALTGIGSLLMAEYYAISEETFFRGALTNYLYFNMPSFPAIILSGLTFMIYHQLVYGYNPQAMLYVLFCGFILGWVFIQTRSLATVILAHASNNGISTLLGLGYSTQMITLLFLALIMVFLLLGFRKVKGRRQQ